MSENPLKRISCESENQEEPIPQKIMKKDCENCSNLKEQVSSLQEKLEKQSKENKASFAILSSKVDKVVRLLSDLAENEGKLSKNVASIMKTLEKKEEKSVTKPNVNNSLGVFLKNLQGENAPEKVPLKQRPYNELDELKWGQNTFLLGDQIFKLMQEVPDIKEQFDKMKKSLQMNIRAKEKVTIANFYDRSRDKLIFALPNKVLKIVLSVGGQDLFEDSLITLKQASLEEVKQRNKSRLKEKASTIKAMIQKLISLGKSVVYIIPVTSVQRREVFDQFEEILLEVLQNEQQLPFPQFKLLNFPKLIKSTKSEFASHEEHLKAWFVDLQKSTLSEYGCRRLLEEIKKTILLKSPKNGQIDLNKAQVKVLRSDEPAFHCPRCTRLHQGGPDNCRSLKMACRICHVVGHYSDVHDVVDEEFKKLIVQTIGIDIYGEFTNEDQSLAVPQPSISSEALNDWYN